MDKDMAEPVDFESDVEGEMGLLRTRKGKCEVGTGRIRCLGPIVARAYT
jgi:hypothetical protein